MIWNAVPPTSRPVPSRTITPPPPPHPPWGGVRGGRHVEARGGGGFNKIIYLYLFMEFFKLKF
jgi:hypothetical protein